jgi:hypothetical protein
MFRVVLLAAVAAIAFAQNDTTTPAPDTTTPAPTTTPEATEPPSTLSPIEATLVAVKACQATYFDASSDEQETCEVIMALQKCLATGGLADLEGTEKQGDFLATSSILTLAESKNDACVPIGDLSYEVSLKAQAAGKNKLFRFSTEGIAFIDIADKLEEIKDTAAYTDSVQTRAAKISLDIATQAKTLKTLILEDVNTIETDAGATKIELNKQLNDLKEDVGDALDAMEDKLTTTTEELESAVDAQIAALTETALEKLAKYKKQQTWPNVTGDPKWYKEYELIQVARAPKDTENGHAGRMMYKVNFNPNNPGFWYPHRDEFYRACTRLSDDLKSVDGVDRGLKPACDQDWACDGNSVQLRGSYLSHCGCGSYPRQRQCVGMTTNFLRGAAMYNRYHSWRGCWMLRHDGRDCHHHWSDCYQRQGVRSDFTICTSSNANFKK